MNVFSHLLDIDPNALMGRDPASLMMDVLDDSAQDGLAQEMRALGAMVESRSLLLPFGRARDLTVQMSPLLCSLARDEEEVDDAIAFVHDWIVSLGDVAATARIVNGAIEQVRIVFAENGDIDLDSFTRLHPEDQAAISLYEDLEKRTSVTSDMAGWSLQLLVANHETLAVMIIVQGRKVVIGVGWIDQDDGRPQAAPKVPLLVA